MVSFSYPIAVPTSPAPAMIQPRPRSVVAVGRSPFTLQRDKQVFDGQLLVWDITLPPIINPADYSAWEAFFYRMNGRQGTCTFGDVTRTAPRGAYDSGQDTPLVDSSASPAPNQEGDNVLVTDGWRLSGTGLLLQSDWLQLGSGATASLHKVLTDVDSDGAGAASIDIWPRLRRTPNDNAVVTLANTVGLWELADNEFPYDIRRAKAHHFKFTLVEALG